MNKEQQDKLWNELSEESKEFILNRYNWLKSQREIAVDTISWNEYQLGLNEWEEMYGSHNLNPKPLTYEDVAKELFGGKDVAFINSDGDIDGFRCVILNSASNPNVCTSSKQAKKLLAINKLLNVAKYLNGDWKPDWKNEYEKKWEIDLIDGKITMSNTLTYQPSIVYFRTKELAEKALQILGEETIRLALSTDY